MSIPKDYFERVYSGWLGKIIGIRLGAPIEGWSYERIRNIYGEVTGYPVSYKNFAADDDSNGPLFFIRALEDCKDLSAFSASDVADALLNYAPYEHGFFWWGGYGTSTEHTAYLNEEEIPLTVREFNLLYKLLSYPKKTFTRSQLMDEFWDGDTSSGPRTVDVYMTKLRSKFADCDDFEIVTVHGLGYKAVLK